MKHYYSYVPISAKIHKKQNRMTLLCITLAVFLVTVIFSTVDMMVRQEMNHLIAKHGETEFQSFLERPGVTTLYPVAILLFLFVLIAGSLMITGSLSSNVTQRTRFFGMMRCIGMSRKQVMNMVRLEALIWCKVAIPMGIVLGTAGEWVLCAVMKYVVAGEFSDMPQLGISITGIISGILMGLFSVLIAAERPARKASKVTPLSAITEAPSAVVRKMKNGNFLRIESRLGAMHATGGRLALMASSFAISIILFLSFSVILQLVDCMMPQSVAKADIEITGDRSDNDIDAAIMEKIGQMEGVKHVYGRRSLLNQRALSSADSNMETVEVISYDLYEMECLKQDGILKAGADLSALKENGYSCFVISDADYKKGDKISFGDETLKIVGQLRYDIFESDGLSKGRTTVIVPDETFENITGIRDYGMIFVQLKKQNSDETAALIYDIVGDKADYYDAREDDTYSTYLAFKICVYGFLAIIALVAVLNIVNSISMSVSSRLKQYGTMRAVGMDEMQLIRMIREESGTYAVTGLFTGLLIGLGLNRLLCGYLVTSHFPYEEWSFPVMEMCVILLFIIFALLLGVHIPARQIKGMSITETISAL